LFAEEIGLRVFACRTRLLRLFAHDFNTFLNYVVTILVMNAAEDIVVELRE
jgi:hypothetical protein